MLKETAYISNEILIDQLSNLAAWWRSSQNENIVFLYRKIFEFLLDKGWDGLIDADAELPEKFMPERYISAHPRV